MKNFWVDPIIKYSFGEPYYGRSRIEEIRFRVGNFIYDFPARIPSLLLLTILVTAYFAK